MEYSWSLFILIPSQPILKIFHSISAHRNFFFRLKIQINFVIGGSVDIFDIIWTDDKLSVDAEKFGRFKNIFKLVQSKICWEISFFGLKINDFVFAVEAADFIDGDNFQIITNLH